MNCQEWTGDPQAFVRRRDRGLGHEEGAVGPHGLGQLAKHRACPIQARRWYQPEADLPQGVAAALGDRGIMHDRDGEAAAVEQQFAEI